MVNDIDLFGEEKIKELKKKYEQLDGKVMDIDKRIEKLVIITEQNTEQIKELIKGTQNIRETVVKLTERMKTLTIRVDKMDAKVNGIKSEIMEDFKQLIQQMITSQQSQLEEMQKSQEKQLSKFHSLFRTITLELMKLFGYVVAVLLSLKAGGLI